MPPTVSKPLEPPKLINSPKKKNRIQATELPPTSPSLTPQETHPDHLVMCVSPCCVALAAPIIPIFHHHPLSPPLPRALTEEQQLARETERRPPQVRRGGRTAVAGGAKKPRESDMREIRRYRATGGRQSRLHGAQRRTCRRSHETSSVTTDRGCSVDP